jgi:hypothetical protein
MKPSIETNPRNCLDIQLHLPSRALLMITAPLQDDCWLFRVRLAEDIVLAAVPVFGGVNINLQSKESVECYMPYEAEGADILDTFRARTKNAQLDGKCLKAIDMLQEEIKKWRGISDDFGATPKPESGHECPRVAASGLGRTGALWESNPDE